MDRHAAWIQEAAGERPELAPALAELGQLYHQRLWHELTVRLEAMLDSPEFQTPGFLAALYENFISGFAHKINLLKLAFFAVAVGRQMADPKVGGQGEGTRAGTREGTREGTRLLHDSVATCRRGWQRSGGGLWPGG